MNTVSIQEEEKTLLLAKEKKKPIPKLLVVPALLYVMADGFISAYIFSFLPYLVQHFFHFPNKSNIGYFAGFIGCVMEMGRFLGSPSWIILSDRIGRRRVILFTLITNMFCLIAFGTASSFLVLVIARFFQGLSCGRAVVKAYLANLSDSSNEAIVFSLYAMVWSVGEIFGPVIGGFLWDPASIYPSVFSQNSIFATHPSLLSSLIIVGVELLNLILCWKFLVEVPYLTSAKKNTPERIESDHLQHGQEACTSCYVYLPGICGYINYLCDPMIRKLFWLATMTAISASAFDTVIPIWAETPQELGGLGYDPPTVGTVQAFCGVVSFFGLFLHWYLLKKWGAIRVYQVAILILSSSFFWPIVITGMNWEIGRTLSFRLLILMYICRAIAYGALFLALNILAKNNVDVSEVGAIMGLFGSATAIGMCLGPYATASIYAWSIGPSAENILPIWLHQGRFAFLLIICFEVCIGFLTFSIKKHKSA